MQNRISEIAERPIKRDGAEPVSKILEELFAQYERRFPDIHITVVETIANAM